MRSLIFRSIAAIAVAITGMSANAGPLPERVKKAAQARIAAGTYQTLVGAIPPSPAERQEQRRGVAHAIGLGHD
jgi:hypothetical protein